MTWAQTGLPCPCGASSDAYAINDEGWGHCFRYGCGRNDAPESSPKTERKPTSKRSLISDIEYKSLNRRGLNEKACRKFQYGTGTYNNKPVQVAPYFDDKGKPVAQKLRFADKGFTVTGDLGKATLFGQQAWNAGGKRVVVTEGEIDAISYAQASNLSWPVVSVPNGAQGAKKAVVAQSEWLCSFEEVVFLFDNDEPGREAARECAEALPPGKAKIAKLDLKDANDMLQAGRVKDLRIAVWNAEGHRPDGLHAASHYREAAVKPVEWGLPWPWPGLTSSTYGRRRSELYGVGAGTGCGKTDVFTQIIAHVLEVDKLPAGVIYLEQPPAETLKRIAGKAAGKRFHVPDAGWTEAELTETIDRLCAGDRLYLFDAFGCTDWEAIKPKIRYMVQALGIKDVFLDHLTALAAGSDNEKEALEEIMADMASLTRELDFTLYFISHLTTPEGKPHEEGGRVMVRHFKGSRAIGFWSDFMFGIERNQQSDDPDEKRTTLIRVLKDRNTGQGTGDTHPLLYDQETGLLNEKPAEPKDAAQDFDPEDFGDEDF